MSRLLSSPVLLMIAATACSSSESKKPALEDCAGCTFTPPGGMVGSGGGSGGASGAAGASGTAGAAGKAMSVSLTGTINAITTGDLVGSAPYAGMVIVTAKTLDGSDTTAKAASDYLLPDVASGPQWISTKPIGVDALGTLTFTTIPQKDAQLNLMVVRNEALTTVLGTLPKPVSLASQSAHAIVFFRTPEGVALPATKLTPSFTAEVGHDDGPGYGGVETHGRGIAVVFNAKPAADAMATIEHAGMKATVTLPLAADQVTMVTLTLQP